MTPGSRPASRVILAGGLLYFLVVFACGFVLGVGRTLWLVPRIGERWAELVETPVMLVVIYLAARWVSGRFSLAALGTLAQAGVGLVGLVSLLGAEIGFVLQLRGISFADYVAQRDPVSGAVYALSLGLFAVMPVLVVRAGGRGVRLEPMTLEEQGKGPVALAEEDLPPLSDEIVRETIERTRR